MMQIFAQMLQIYFFTLILAVIRMIEIIIGGFIDSMLLKKIALIDTIFF